MLSPQKIQSKLVGHIDNKARKLFIIHSNLHLLQALTLSDSEYDLCVYTEAVSEQYLIKWFKGAVYKVENNAIFSLRELYPLKRIWNKKNKQLSVFLGNKQNFWSTFILNAFPTSNISILDDGLSSYGVSSELYTEKNRLRRVIKKSTSVVLHSLGLVYFNEASNFEIDRACSIYYFFPERLNYANNVKKIKFDSNVFFNFFDLSNVPSIDKVVRLASYDESIAIVKNPNDKSLEHNFLHPRVTGSSPEIPTEIAVYNSKGILLGPTSVIVFLIFMNYKGKYYYVNEELMKIIYDFFTSPNGKLVP